MLFFKRQEIPCNQPSSTFETRRFPARHFDDTLHVAHCTHVARSTQHTQTPTPLPTDSHALPVHMTHAVAWCHAVRRVHATCQVRRVPHVSCVMHGLRRTRQASRATCEGRAQHTWHESGMHDTGSAVSQHRVCCHGESRSVHHTSRGQSTISTTLATH